MKNRTRRRAVATVAAAALTLGLAACSDGTEAGTSPAGQETPATAEASTDGDALVDLGKDLAAAEQTVADWVQQVQELGAGLQSIRQLHLRVEGEGQGADV